MSKFKPLLMKVKVFWFKRFKNHDRIYFISPEDKLRLTSDLHFHIFDIKDPELRDHIRLNSLNIPKKERIDWNKLRELSV